VATIPFLPMLSGRDHEGSDKGSYEGSDKDEGLKGDTPKDDGGNDDPGFNFLPDEQEDDKNSTSKITSSLLMIIIVMPFPRVASKTRNTSILSLIFSFTSGLEIGKSSFEM
jgi:hypothetical protein